MNFEKHCWAEIDLGALRYNYRLIARLAGSAKVCAVLKADAYGHGDVMTAQVLAQEGTEWFAVSSLSEALHLRRAGLEQRILVLGHTDPAQAIVLHRQQILQTVYSPDYAAALSDAAAAARDRYACMRVLAGVEKDKSRATRLIELLRSLCGAWMRSPAPEDPLPPARAAHAARQAGRALTALESNANPRLTLTALALRLCRV